MQEAALCNIRAFDMAWEDSSFATCLSEPQFPYLGDGDNTICTISSLSHCEDQKKVRNLKSLEMVMAVSI